MDKQIVAALAANFQRVHGFTLQFIDQCPSTLWTKTFGGWPVWQHIVHVYGVIDFFTLQQGQTATPCPSNADVVMLRVVGGDVVSKETMLPYLAAMKAKADAYSNSLTDTMLGEKNEGLSARKNEHITHATTMARLGSHAFYHFGTLDAALREQGLPGLF